MNETLFRSYEVRAEVRDGDNGTIAATVNVLGSPDSYNSVIMPGAIRQEVIDAFLRDGFVADGHNWGQPIAMPTMLEMRGNDLVGEAAFHSDPDSQRVRTRCAERMAAGLSVGTSIGFQIDWSEVREFASGAKMLQWADDNGMPGLDREAIAALDYCWAIPRVTRLFEWSVATVPSNPKALAASVRSILTEERSGLTLADHLDSALAAASGALARFSGYRELRAAEGRRVSPDRFAQIRELASSLSDLAQACEIPVEAPAIDDTPDRVSALRSFLLRTTAP